MRKMQDFWIQIEWTMTGHSRTTTSRRKEFCTWCCVCVVKCSWRLKPSCWTLRRPTPMTTWKPRSRESTRSTTWTRERAPSVAVFVVSSVLSHSSLAHNTLAQDVCVCASFHSHGHRHTCMSWAFSLTSLTFSSSSPSSSHPLCTLAKEVGSTDKSFSNTGYEPKDYFLRETYVDFNQESMTEQRFAEQRFPEDVDTMMPESVRCSLTHTEHKSITPSEKACLLVSRRRQMSDGTGQPVVETGQELNSELAQIRTLFGPTEGANTRRLSGGD